MADLPKKSPRREIFLDFDSLRKTMEPRARASSVATPNEAASSQKTRKTKPQNLLNLPGKFRTKESHGTRELACTLPNQHIRRKSFGHEIDKPGVPPLDIPKPAASSSKKRKWKEHMSKTQSAKEMGKHPNSQYEPLSKPMYGRDMLRSVLDLMGYSKSQAASFLKTLPPVEDFDDPAHVCFRAHDLTLANHIIFQSKALIQFAKKQRAATKIQALFRGRALRKRLKPILADRNRIVKFNATYISLIQIERKYIRSLELLLERYLTPLRNRITMNKEVMKLQDISYVFCNIETILELHQKKFSALDALSKSWPTVTGVGQAILELRSGLKAYGIYVGNLKSAKSTIQQLKLEKNGKLSPWLQKVAQKHPETPDLVELLSLPVDHIKVMERIIEELSGYTLPASTEEQQVNDAFSMLHETNQFIHENLLQSDVKLSLTNIERRIVHEKPLNLNKPGRTFKIETAFTVGYKKRTFLLFSDLLIITKPMKNNQLRFREQHDLANISFETSPTDKTVGIIKTPDVCLRFQGRTEDIVVWQMLFDNFLQTQKKNQTIGVSIETILQREGSSIPSIVTQTIEYILQLDPQLNTEGLFRLSPDQREIVVLRDMFDNFTPAERSLSGHSIHGVGGLLKLWLRELPDPVIHFSLYEKLLQLERNSEAFVGMNDKLKSEITTLLQSLGPSYATLEYIIRFLSTLCKNAAVNKMTASNIAIVFGPNLLRPEVESLETALNCPIVNHVIQRFVEFADQLFPEKSG